MNREHKQRSSTDGQRAFKKAVIPSRELSRYASRGKATNPIRRTKEYKDFHDLMISQNPVCAKHGCNEPTTDIHHKVRITDNPDLALDPSNVICTCTPCHHQIESAVNRGIDPEIWKHLFEGL